MEHRVLLFRARATHERSRVQKLVASSFSTSTRAWLLLASFLGTLALQNVAHREEKTRESLQLTQALQLGPEALAKIRAEALELERRALIYGRVPPAELNVGGAGR